ncbi:unnamed protein product [Caenorhabditis angaria]|uniref:C2H2-type domain-containing protein n=1 Tax=Caenorhabditis angaria TaxID=860376 RepID=A0A9P1MW55_9PELO|nr:unnamed protein product [Caenorhabditis angaria]
MSSFDDFSIVFGYLERCETRQITRKICAEELEHETVACECFEDQRIDEKENIIPEKLDYYLVQPDGKMTNELKRDNLPVPTIFVADLNSSKRQVTKTGGSKKRKTSVLKETEGAKKRREIKKKLFNDLGIHRSNCGIDDKAKQREDSMKRKVTETIVTTYCALCEQNFSSPKMLLLHNTKVHETPSLECHLCMKRFDQTITFNRHMKTHYGPNAQYLVQCEFCDRKFKDKDSLTTHIEVTH